MAPLADTLGALPELVLTVTALGLLGAAGVWRSPRLVAGLTLAGLLGAAAALWPTLSPPGGARELFSGLLLRTPLIGFFQVGIVAATALVVLLAAGYAPLATLAWVECYPLLLLATVGLLLVTGAQSLVTVYVGLELVSLPSYLLTGLWRREASSAEGGLKYFLFGTLATAFMLYGISWVYGAAGTLSLPALAAQTVGGAHPHQPLLAAGILLVLVGLAFKVALVPFHQWAPDAYEGAPTPIAAFISAGPKLAGFALLLRLLGGTFQGLAGLWAPSLALLAILTMTVGNVVALWQTNVKRLLAYSSIAQAGYIVIGLVAAGPSGAAAVTYYAVIYGLMNLAAFACVIAVSNGTGRDDLGAYAGLAQTRPALAAAFAIALLSLAGIPPTAGFLAKVVVFAAALQSGWIWLAVIAAANSVIALYYYAGLLQQMYLRPPVPMEGAAQARSPWPLTLALGATVAGVLLLGLWPAPLLTWIAQALSTAGA